MKSIAIVGAGAAGMAAAWSLSQHPEKFKVTVFEAGLACGGVACSLTHDSKRINYGVQGGAPASHQNTIELMKYYKMEPVKARLDVSFGKNQHNWKNYNKSDLQEKLSSEIKKFGKVLKWVSRFEFVTIFMSIESVLKMFRFSDDFRNRMVYPLVALFFGTGNATSDVSAAVIARVFNDENLALFEYDPEYFVSESPENIAFQDLELFYEKMKSDLENRGNCEFLLKTEVKKVERLDGKVQVTFGESTKSWKAGSDQYDECFVNKDDYPPNTFDNDKEQCLVFDEIILACPANVSAKIVTDQSFLEKSILNNVQYFSDLTVTHTDETYMRKHYDVDEKAIYYIKTYDNQPENVEMGFNLSKYQPMLKQAENNSNQTVYQTIFLDKGNQNNWTIDEIDNEKIIDETWWKAFSHTVTHFRKVVPWVWSIQGKRNTWFAGSWVLFNTHDIAICSGFACAKRLGASYPFENNSLAKATFDVLMKTSHLKF